MVSFRFGWTELYEGNRFLAPLSESALHEAGVAAELQAGETLLEVGCGAGGASLYLAEEFHLYARGLDASRKWVTRAQEHARRSPAANRLRYFHEDAAHPGAEHGPVDVVCALHGDWQEVFSCVRPGGSVLLGRYVQRRPDAPQELLESFGIAPRDPPGELRWSREASPMEWERFLRPQERVLRRLRKSSPIAELARRRIELFRAHGAAIAYELELRLP